MEYLLAPAGTPHSPLREPTRSLKRSDAASPCRTPAWLPTGKPTLEETRCENKQLQVNRCGGPAVGGHRLHPGVRQPAALGGRLAEAPCLQPAVGRQVNRCFRALAVTTEE